MPVIFYWLGAILPTTYYITLLRGIILRGATVQDLTQEILVLAVMGVVLFAVCALRFRKKIG
jgi:ABC-2 type transport system permease protein